MIKHIWDDTKIFWYFVLAFILIFHVGGAIWFDMTWSDLSPMYVLFAVIGLTLVTHRIKTYKEQKEIDEKWTSNGQANRKVR